MDGGSLPRVFEVLTDGSAPEQEDCTLFSPAKGRLVLLHKGETLQEVLSDVGFAVNGSLSTSAAS
jgi:hypothetical protein